MSTTPTVPVRLNARGGLQMETKNSATLLSLGVLPTGPMHAFARRDGLVVPDYTWERDDPAFDAGFRARVEEESRRLEMERRARVEQVRRRSSGEGNVVYELIWTDLETGQVQTTVLPTATGVGF